MVSVADYGLRDSCSRPGRFAVRCGLEQVTFTPCLVLKSKTLCDRLDEKSKFETFKRKGLRSLRSLNSLRKVKKIEMIGNSCMLQLNKALVLT